MEYSPRRMTSSPEPIDIQIVRPDSEPVSARPVLGLKHLKSIPRNHTFITFNSLNRPANDTMLPPGWTFHSLVQTNPLATPRSDYSLSPTSSLDALDRLPGYFHYAERRITTNIDIIHHEDLLTTLLDDVRTKNTDEFIEMIATPCDRLGSEEERERGYTLYRADHFSRTFNRSGLESRSPFGEAENPMWSDDYSKWIHLIGRSPDSHLFLPSAQPKKYSCLGRKIAQQVVWDHQNGHISKIDVQNAFSMPECTSLLSALQKRRVTDKQCQKIIKTVIDRFLKSKQFKQPPLHPTFSAGHAEGAGGPIVMLAVAITFFIWGGPMLGIPSAYFRRMRTVAARADKGGYLPHLWSTFIKGLLKEWNDLNIVLALVLSANVGFLSLPGLSEDDHPPIADLSRAAGIFSTFVTLGGLLSSLSLIWLHQPMLGTGSSDACKYILGPSFNGTHVDGGHAHLPHKRGSFLRLLWMATYLGMPLVLLVWSVIAFVICALAWTVMFSAIGTRVTVVVLSGLMLTTPLVTILVFWGPIVSKDSLFGKMARGDPLVQHDHDSQY
ncbi:hypothetical protein RSOLAG22IIIB_00376 [Rhizoctonia solani]|uniref:Uncharacterized protein n=1 Tax=Rhizoctonia solani TaxID=456999 RepID=A0A0K6FL23_9AGAM|nr:unnamed protein product [Rhizoctonia solani]CUA66926.1 hypothetical protein RSOLAG22IIIB_00376 [Rhizoctonia solani]